MSVAPLPSSPPSVPFRSNHVSTVESGPAGPPVAARGRTWELDHAQALPPVGVHGAWVKVVYGCIWISATGSSNDRLVESEEPAVRVPRGSVIRSIGRTRVEIVDAHRPRRSQHFLGRVRRWLRRMRTRVASYRIRCTGLPRT